MTVEEFLAQWNDASPTMEVRTSGSTGTPKLIYIEKERMRANLLRAVSHDIRTPLTTIYGSAATLLENGGSLSPDQRKLMLQSIQNDSVWLVRMVENLLSITRIDSGQVKIIKIFCLLPDSTAIMSRLLRFPRFWMISLHPFWSSSRKDTPLKWFCFPCRRIFLLSPWMLC